MESELAPGFLVRNPSHPDWGLGQVQSVVGLKATVNFENMGKMTINTAIVTLEVVSEDLRAGPSALGSPAK
jgi:hypothetical protein